MGRNSRISTSRLKATTSLYSDGKKSGRHGLGDAQDQAAQHGAGDGADAAQYRSGKRLEAGHETDVGVDGAVVEAQQHARNGGQGSTDDEGQRDDAVGIDAEQVGHLQILGAGAAGAAEAGTGNEQRQAGHRDQRDRPDDQLHPGDGNLEHLGVAEFDAAGNQCRHCQVTGTLRQTDVVLQEDRHADGGDQRDQPGTATQRSVGHPFNGIAVGGGDDDRGDQRQQQHDRQRADPQGQQTDDGDERGIGTDHVHLAVGEVDHADNAIHHRVADGDQRVGRADGQSVDQLLKYIKSRFTHL